jgi:antitoxin component of MazEF toxin-antitoxin module
MAEQLKLKAGQQVTFQIERDVITIRPSRKKWSEAELLAGVTPAAAGGEVNWGGRVGREVW